MSKTNFLFVGTIFFVISNFYACGIYSLSGISIENEKTIKIDYFPNKSRLVSPILSPVFTEKLQQKFVNESPLELVEQNADLIIDGSITNYSINPAASGGDDEAQLNRLTIEVLVNFQNTLKDEEWSQRFRRYEDFEKDQILTDVEEDLIDIIAQQLVDDIFNKALVNW